MLYRELKLLLLLIIINDDDNDNNQCQIIYQRICQYAVVEPCGKNTLSLFLK